jgi:hypothetical protein
MRFDLGCEIGKMPLTVKPNLNPPVNDSTIHRLLDRRRTRLVSRAASAPDDFCLIAALLELIMQPAGIVWTLTIQIGLWQLVFRCVDRCCDAGRDAG